MGMILKRVITSKTNVIILVTWQLHRKLLTIILVLSPSKYTGDSCSLNVLPRDAAWSSRDPFRFKAQLLLETPEHPSRLTSI